MHKDENGVQVLDVVVQSDVSWRHIRGVEVAKPECKLLCAWLQVADCTLKFIDYY